MKRQDMDIILSIVKRAEKMKLLTFGRLSFLLDLDVADNTFSLRLNDLLATDDFNFMHDVCGIQNSIDRVHHKMNNQFVPRFAK